MEYRVTSHGIKRNVLQPAISKAISLCGSWLSTGIGKSSVNDIRLVLYGSPGLACYRDASIPNYRPGLV